MGEPSEQDRIDEARIVVALRSGEPDHRWDGTNPPTACVALIKEIAALLTGRSSDDFSVSHHKPWRLRLRRGEVDRAQAHLLAVRLKRALPIALPVLTAATYLHFDASASSLDRASGRR